MKRTLFFSLVWILLFCGSACRKDSDLSGQNSAAKKVVTLAPAITEIAFTLGCGDSVIARTDACDYPEAVKKLPVAGHFGDPDAERILSLKPDLLLANTLINPRIKDLFTNAGIRVIVKPCETVEDYLAWLDIFAAELNVEAAVKKEKTRVQKHLEYFHALPNTGKSAIVLLWDTPLIAAGSGTLPDTALRLAGIKNAAEKEKGYFKCSREFFMTSNFDVIVLAMKKPLPDDLRNGRKVYSGFSPDTLLRPGPRFLETGVRELRDFFEKLNESAAGDKREP